MSACPHTTKSSEVCQIPCSQCLGVRVETTIPSGESSYAYEIEKPDLESARRGAMKGKKNHTLLPPTDEEGVKRIKRGISPPAGWVSSSEAADMLGFDRMRKGRDEGLEHQPDKYGNGRYYSVASIEARIARAKAGTGE